MIASVFGLALRTYQRKVQRLMESQTDQHRTLWEAVVSHIAEQGPVTRADIDRRFDADDALDVAAVLKDLVASGLAYRSGEGALALYRATSLQDQALFAKQQQLAGATEFVWLALFSLPRSEASWAGCAGAAAPPSCEVRVRSAPAGTSWCVCCIVCGDETHVCHDGAAQSGAFIMGHSRMLRGLWPLALLAILGMACDGDEDTTAGPIAPGAACSPDGTRAAADDGCNSCTCEAGAWGCTEIACPGDGGTGPCEDGDTRPHDDGCNTCTCEDAEWRCTLLGCVECPDPIQSDDPCDTVVVYAKDPADGRCCEYGTPCAAPDGWQQHSTSEACEDATGALRWHSTCGDPACGPNSDDPTGETPCSDGQAEGAACEDEGALCDGAVGCGANLICASSDPKQVEGGCPI